MRISLPFSTSFDLPVSTGPEVCCKWLKRLVVVNCLSLGAAATAAGQASYTGRIGSTHIKLSLAEISSGVGVYLYSKIGTPIALRSSLHHEVLTLTEYAADRLITTQNFRTTKYKLVATFTIKAFSFDAPVLRGTWRSLVTKQQLPLILTLTASADDAGTAVALPSALQIESTPAYYFKTLLKGNAGDPTTRVGAVQVVEKKTNRICQQFPVNCRAIGQGSVSVDDYNFDGLLDFSIYKDDGDRPQLSADGYSNGKSLYFLYNPVTKSFIASGFQGVGLTFDAKKKRVYEYTPSRTYGAMTKAEYRVVHNHLVLTTKQCLTFHAYQGFIVSEPSACQ